MKLFEGREKEFSLQEKMEVLLDFAGANDGLAESFIRDFKQIDEDRKWLNEAKKKGGSKKAYVAPDHDAAAPSKSDRQSHAAELTKHGVIGAHSSSSANFAPSHAATLAALHRPIAPPRASHGPHSAKAAGVDPELHHDTRYDWKTSLHRRQVGGAAPVPGHPGTTLKPVPFSGEPGRIGHQDVHPREHAAQAMAHYSHHMKKAALASATAQRLSRVVRVLHATGFHDRAKEREHDLQTARDLAHGHATTAQRAKEVHNNLINPQTGKVRDAAGHEYLRHTRTSKEAAHEIDRISAIPHPLRTAGDQEHLANMVNNTTPSHQSKGKYVPSWERYPGAHGGGHGNAAANLDRAEQARLDRLQAGHHDGDED